MIKAIYPDVDVGAWCEKNQLRPGVYVCDKCGNKFQYDTPILIKGYAGVVTSEHECGRRFIGICLVPNKPESLAIWNSILGKK